MMTTNDRRVVFLDRDNTLNKDEGYFHDAANVVLLPGVVEGLKKLRDAGFLLIAISNQSGVGRGYFPEADTIAVNKKLAELLAEKGVRLEKVYYCPHKPEDNCECRKPKPFLVFKAAGECGADLAKSFFVGNHMNDIETGRNAGITAILVGSSEIPDLSAAADNIIEHEKARQSLQR